MLELTGLGSVLRGLSVLYWILGLGAMVIVLWKVRPWWAKTAGAMVVVAAFGYLPLQELIEANKREAYAREAWAYFKKKCDTESGEKIYKTFTGVKSVLVVKPLPPANGNALYDQFWLGDPYSNATPGERGESAALKLASLTLPISFGKEGRGFNFVEFPTNAEGKFLKFAYAKGAYEHVSEPIGRPVSRFGISWEDISTPADRKFWVAGSRLRVIDLVDKSIVAERIGYFIEAGFGSRAGQRTPWLSSRGKNTTCPWAHDFSDRWFVLKVLRPVEEIRDGK